MLSGYARFVQIRSGFHGMSGKFNMGEVRL
jgi:hypothetical protein